MPLEELRETVEYRRLTEKQQRFVDHYISAGYNVVEAVLVAYQCRNTKRSTAREIARVMSYPLMQSRRILLVLNMHFGKDPIERFLDQLDRAIDKKKLSVTHIKALALKAKVLERKEKKVPRISKSPAPQKAPEPSTPSTPVDQREWI